MMKKLTILFFFLTAYFNQAQLFIEDKAPWITTEDLGTVNFFDDNTGWITGTNGLILKTSDGGNNWIKLNTGFGTNAQEGYPPDKLIITGPQDLIIRIVISGFPVYEYQWIRSSDGGESWTEIIPPVPYKILDLTAFNSDNFIAAGEDSLLMKSTNKGITWEIINYSPGSGYSISNIFFLDDLNGWYSSIDSEYIQHLFKTTDGGSSWFSLTDNYHGTSLKFFNTETGYSIFPFGVIKTTDGGLNWNIILEQEYTVTLTAKNINEIYLSSGMNENSSGFPLVSRSSDGGITWVQTNYNEGNFRINGIYETAGKTIICGENGFIASSSDRSNFTAQMGDYITGIHAFNDKAIATGYNGELYLITNNGNTWQKIEAGITGGPNHVVFINESTGYIIGENIWRSFDGGLNWTIIAHPPENHKPLYMYNVDRNGILYIEKIEAAESKLYRTADFGDNWILINTPVQYSGYDREFFALDSLKIWVKGESGELFKTTNGGNDWLQINSSINAFSFFASDSGMGFSQFEPQYTTNGGAQWQPLPAFNFGMDVHEIFQKKHFDLNYSYILERGHYLPGDESIHPFEFKMYNEGWFTNLISYESKILSSISFYDKNNGWIAAGRKVFRVTQDSPTASGNNFAVIPEEYQLEQNFPNPFNPETRIRFNLPNPEFVTLKIYDILGRELITLVSRDYEAGTHEMSFSAKDIPSGVYLYKITAGEYISTKKLQVLK